MDIHNLRKEIHKKDFIAPVIFSLLFAILLFVLSNISETATLITTFAVILFIIIFLFNQNKRIFTKSIRDNHTNLYNQVQAYTDLHHKIQPISFLPPMTGSAILPDLANILIKYIENNKPETIVECGSGVSTIISAYCLKNNKKGKIYSLDHEQKYLEITQENLKTHKVSEYVELIHSPVIDFTINNKKHKFYDINLLNNISEIDILFVDGPPRTIQPDIRFASVPLFYDKIKTGGIIILDDADRKPEKQAINEWLKKYPNLKYNYIPTEKGTVILTKTE